MASSKKEPTVRDELLEEGEYLALAFARNVESTKVKASKQRLMKFDVAFFQIQGFERLTYRDLGLHDSQGGSRGPLAPESGVDFTRLYNSDGEDIARVETDENVWQLSHFAPSVLEGDVRVYPRVPETETQPGFTWAVGARPDPTVGEEFGFVSGKEMDYYSPPKALQTVAFQSGDTSNFQYGFYNENSEKRVDPTLTLQGRTYRTVPVSSEQTQERILKQAGTGDEGVNILTWGPVTDSYSINLLSEWDEAGAIRSITGSLFSNGGSA
jgi:hypothetical protein